MKNVFLFILFSLYGQTVMAQLECPTLTNPVNDATNVAVETTIEWNAIEGAPGYLISIGTTPNGTDLLNEQNVGNATSYTPPLGLPEATDIYVTIAIFFFNAENIVCTTETFRTEDVTTPPNCTQMTVPSDGLTNVNVGTPITWNYAPKANGYRISIGTTPGRNDVIDNQNITGTLSFQPPNNLNFMTEYFVTIEPFNENGAAGLCQVFSFTTGAMAVVPSCTRLVSPTNEATNVALSPVLEWIDVPDADGYRVSIGTTPFNSNVLDNVNFTNNNTMVIDFEPNRTFFITIIPFNAAGEAIGCTQESFSTQLGCSYFDAQGNEFVSLQPSINFPDTVSICSNEQGTLVVATDDADGFNWYQINANGTETLLSSTPELTLTEAGNYRYEAYYSIDQSETTIACSASKAFNVLVSEIATITAVNTTNQLGKLRIEVVTSGAGNYEFALNTINGPYQDRNIFENVTAGATTIYVRDKNGCGIASQTIQQDLTTERFPKFFTPNGDNINDYWQISPPLENDTFEVSKIEIFDRYGLFLIQIDPTSRGWDGRFNGKLVPAADYWFKATTLTNKIIRGHFALKR